MHSTATPSPTQTSTKAASRPKLRPVISALFFDAAGTLIDTAEPVAETYHRILGAHGHPIPVETLTARFPRAFAEAGDPDFAGLPNGNQAERAWWRGIVERCADTPVSDPAFDALFTHYAHPDAWKALPDVEDTLAGAAAMGLRLAVVSNFDARLHLVLEGLGLAGHFELILTSGDARARKPDPAIFEIAMERMGLQPHQIRHTGDSHRCDAEGARNAGIAPFLLDRPQRDLIEFLQEVRHELRK